MLGGGTQRRNELPDAFVVCVVVCPYGCDAEALDVGERTEYDAVPGVEVAERGGEGPAASLAMSARTSYIETVELAR